jgi:hypothetical protein
MTKTCGIHQPNLLPWIGYFYKIHKSDCFVFLDNVDIVTGSASAITNRTSVIGPSGVLLLTAPIKKSDTKKINTIEYVGQPWKEKMLKTLEYSYKKSSSFNSFFPIVQEIFSCSSDNLANFNMNAIKLICEYLEIQTELYRASEFTAISQERNERLVDLCQNLGCGVYFSGNGAKKYQNNQMFSDSKIDIIYSDFVHPTYNQRNNTFVKGLSIIDYLFNVSKEETIFIDGERHKI